MTTITIGDWVFFDIHESTNLGQIVKIDGELGVIKELDGRLRERNLLYDTQIGKLEKANFSNTVKSMLNERKEAGG